MAHRRRATPTSDVAFKRVRKGLAEAIALVDEVEKDVISSGDLSASGKLAPAQGTVGSALHGDITPPKPKKLGPVKPEGDDDKLKPTGPTSDVTAPVSAGKKLRKKVDPESTEGMALELYVDQMVHKYSESQPRGEDGKWIPSGDAVGPGKWSTNPPAADNPYIVPSGNPKPAADAPPEAHAKFHAQEMIHWLKQQVTAYQAGHDTHGDELQHLITSHATQYSHHSGIHFTKSKDGPSPILTGLDAEIAQLQEQVSVAKAALLAAREAETGQQSVSKRLFVEFVEKADTAVEKQLVTGVVLAPEVVDAQGDIYDEDVIEEAAHKFLAKYNAGCKMGHLHKNFNSLIDLVESYIVPADFTLENRVITKGTWMMTVKVKDPTMWDKVKNGELTGFSIGGIAKVKKLGT